MCSPSAKRWQNAGGKLSVNNYMEKMKGPEGSEAKQEPMQSFQVKATDLF